MEVGHPLVDPRTEDDAELLQTVEGLPEVEGGQDVAVVQGQVQPLDVAQGPHAVQAHNAIVIVCHFCCIVIRRGKVCDL